MTEQFISPIASPLANEKLEKKLFKVIKYGFFQLLHLVLPHLHTSFTDAKQKLLRRGVKEVVKSIRKGKKGFLIFFIVISLISTIPSLVFVLLLAMSRRSMSFHTYLYIAKITISRIFL